MRLVGINTKYEIIHIYRKIIIDQVEADKKNISK